MISSLLQTEISKCFHLHLKGVVFNYVPEIITVNSILSLRRVME